MRRRWAIIKVALKTFSHLNKAPLLPRSKMTNLGKDKERGLQRSNYFRRSFNYD